MHGMEWNGMEGKGALFHCTAHSDTLQLMLTMPWISLWEKGPMGIGQELQYDTRGIHMGVKGPPCWNPCVSGNH